VKLKKNRIFLA